MITLPYTTRVIVYREEEDCWIAHSLEMDLVAAGRIPAKAIQHLREITDVHISSILNAGNLESLFRRAPSDIFALFAASRDYNLAIGPDIYFIGDFNVRITIGD